MTVNAFDIPILFLIFNRLDSALQVFEKIRETRPAQLYIAADGPRQNKPGEAAVCDAIRKAVLERVDWECQARTLFRAENLGCGRAVAEGISWFFENVAMGIILEDDCLPAPDFFGFCREMLLKYQDHDRVYQVAGFNPDGFGVASDTYLFSKYVKIWGWATWRRAWRQYDFNLAMWPKIKRDKIHFRKFSFLEAKIREIIWDRVYRQPKDIWDFQWLFCMTFNNGVAIIPKANMIKNIGCNDVNATHFVNRANPYPGVEYGKLRLPIKHPYSLKTNRRYDRRYSRNYIRRRAQGLLLKLLLRFKPGG